MKSPSEETHKPTCFILMPFTKVIPLNHGYTSLGKDELDTIYELYEEIFSDNGFNVKRSDSVGNILRDIVIAIHSADLIVADLTGLNPNVMYELGLRHAFTKKTIMTSQDISEIPFDISINRCIEYGWKTKREKRELKNKIVNILNKMDSSIDAKYGPVHSYLGERFEMNEFDKANLLNQLDSVGSDIAAICIGFRKMIGKICENFPGSITQNGRLDINKIPKEKLLQTIENYEVDFFDRQYPALEYYIARNRIIPLFNLDSSMSSFNTNLRNCYRFLFSKRLTLDELINSNLIIHLIQEDCAVLRQAIDQEKFGEKLNLKSVQFLHTVEDMNIENV